MPKLQLGFLKVILEHIHLLSKLRLNHSIAMVKDLLADNIDGHVIYFCDEAARIARPDTKNKHRPVVGMPIISVKIGEHC